MIERKMGWLCWFANEEDTKKFIEACGKANAAETFIENYEFEHHFNDHLLRNEYQVCVQAPLPQAPVFEYDVEVEIERHYSAFCFDDDE